MTSIKNIKDKLKATFFVKKIVFSAEAISSSHFKKLYPNILILEECIKSYLDTISSVFKHYNSINYSRYMLVVVGSEKSLCGVFNSRLNNVLLDNFNKSYKNICIGKQLFYKLSSSNNTFLTLSLQKKKNYYEYAKIVTSIIVKSLLRENTDICYVVYTKYYSTQLQIVTSEFFLPVYKKYINNRERLSLSNYSLLLRIIMIKFLIISLFNSIVNSLLSEHSIRMVTMNKSFQNSNKILKQLQLSYSRKRQDIITNELIEVISSYNMKG